MPGLDGAIPNQAGLLVFRSIIVHVAPAGAGP
jgi:hypothetical protein